MVDRARETEAMNNPTTPKVWHPRTEMRWRVAPGTSTEAPSLEQLWQSEQTGELWWRRVPMVPAWEQSEP